MDPRFDWDAENLNHIWDRHRVTDEEAEEVYDDDKRFTYRSDAEGEERLAVVGSTASGRPLTIVITPRRVSSGLSLHGSKIYGKQSDIDAAEGAEGSE